MQSNSENIFKEILPIIDQWLKFQIYKFQAPGVAVGILYKDKIIFKKEYGYANLEEKIKLTDNHLFRCASHAKIFTATGIMKLKSENRLALEDKIAKFLPWFFSEQDPNLEKITIFHLLTHTAGITVDGKCVNGNEWDCPDINLIKEQVQQGISIYKVGEKIKYSNFGYTILGLIIEKITGISYADYIQNQIFTPLNMENSSTDITIENQKRLVSGYSSWYPGKQQLTHPHHKANLWAPAYGLISNVEDMMKFYQAHITGNSNLISDPIKEEMQEEHVSMENGKRGLGFAIGNFPLGQRTLYLNGGLPGFKSHSCLIQKEKIVIVVLTNSMDAQDFSWLAGISEFLNLILLKKEETQENIKDKPVYPDNLGLFESPYGIFLITVFSNKLVAFSMDSWNPAMSPIEFQSRGGGLFCSSTPLPFAKMGEPIQFVKNEKGITILLCSNGSELPRFEFQVD